MVRYSNITWIIINRKPTENDACGYYKWIDADGILRGQYQVTTTWEQTKAVMDWWY